MKQKETQFATDSEDNPTRWLCKECGSPFKAADDQWGSENMNGSNWSFCPECGRKITAIGVEKF